MLNPKHIIVRFDIIIASVHSLIPPQNFSSKLGLSTPFTALKHDSVIAHVNLLVPKAKILEFEGKNNV